MLAERWAEPAECVVKASNRSLVAISALFLGFCKVFPLDFEVERRFFSGFCTYFEVKSRVFMTLRAILPGDLVILCTKPFQKRLTELGQLL